MTDELLQDIVEYQGELQLIRQEFVFKHYIVSELFVNREEFAQMLNDEYGLLKFVIVQTRLISHNSIIAI